MVKRIILMALMPLFASAYGMAQNMELNPYDYEDFDFRGRISVELDKRIVSGLHFQVSEEFRMKENMTQVDRFYTAAGLSYKPCPYFKIAGTYTFRASMAKNSTWNLSNRVALDLNGMYNTGNWKFSLRERVQWTGAMGEMNVYQDLRNEFCLRHRLKAAYTFRNKPVEPYLSVELRNTLNAISYTAMRHESVPGDNVSYNDVYLSRVRFQPGVEWQLSRRSSLDFYLLGDYCFDKKYDANKQGDLKPLDLSKYGASSSLSSSPCYMVNRRQWHLSIGVGYLFEF